MKQNILLLLTVISLSLFSCQPKESADKTQESTTEKKTETSESITGRFSVKNNQISASIVVNGTSWTGKTMLVSGFGDDYDLQHAEIISGIVKGNILYDQSGNVKLGSVSKSSADLVVGGQNLYLTKD